MDALINGIHEYEAGEYFQELQDFIGEERTESRLRKLANQMKHQQGVYFDNWILPRTSWWRGFAKAREVLLSNGTLEGALTPLIERPIQTAVKLSMLAHTLTEQKRNDLAARMGSDPIEPVLLEIDASAHFLSLGYQLEWFSAEGQPGTRIPEFMARLELDGSKLEIEVECKAKQSDAGRMIELEAFYRLADRLIPVLTAKKFPGWMKLVLPKRLPRNDEWFKDLVSAIKGLSNGTGNFSLATHGEIEYSFESQQGQRRRIDDLPAMFPTAATPFAHFAFSGTGREGEQILNPIAIRLESQKEDDFLGSIYESLEDASNQFTKRKAGIISCYVPEVATFDGLEVRSSLKNMTESFFKRKKLPFLYAISYVSDIRREHRGDIIFSDMPSMTFPNPEYDSDFGERFPIYHNNPNRGV